MLYLTFGKNACFVYVCVFARYRIVSQQLELRIFCFMEVAMGGIFHINPETGFGYYMDDKEVAEAGGMLILGLGAFTVFYLVMFVIALAIIAPFITLFILDDIVDTFIVNNALFFTCLGVVITTLKLLPRFTSVRVVRVLFDTYIIVTALYLLLYVLHFDIPVYSFFKIIDNYLPEGADRALLDVIEIDKLSAALEGNWFYEIISGCAEKFLEYVKWSVQNVMDIDNTCFQVPAAELDIFAVIKTVVLYFAIGGFGVLSVLLFGILMVVVFLIAVALPYVLALTAIVMCNKMIYRLHTAKIQNKKTKPISKERFAEITEEFDFLLKGTSGFASQKRTFELSQKLADEGNPYAQLRLAQCYLHGDGTLSNEEKAFYWYEKAAYQGVTKAQIMVAFFYFDGMGVKKNRRFAKAWLNVALQNKEYLHRQKDKQDFIKKVAYIHKKTRLLDCL